MSKLALVTGAAGRIGRHLVEALAEEGFDIALHYFMSAARAEELARRIRDRGGIVHVIRSDLRSKAGVYALAEEIGSISPSLDLLINNASVFPEPEKLRASKSLLEETWEDWELSLGVNARAPFFLIKELYPLLLKGSSPNVINILDSSVSKVFQTRASHSVSKHALAAITELGAATLFPPVRVNALEITKVFFPSDGPSPIAFQNSNDGVTIAYVTESVISLIEDRTANGVFLRA